MLWFYLFLPLKVATTGQEAAGCSGIGGGSGSVSLGGSGTMSSEFSTPGHSRGPQLVRARSGPATLSHAVFEMLYSELRGVLGGMRAARLARARERARVEALKAKKAREEAAVAAAASTVESEEVKDEPEPSANATDGVEVSAAVEASRETETNAGAAEIAEGSGGETGSAAMRSAASGHGSEAEEEGTGTREHEDVEDTEEKVVFERLADMQDDLACLTLSRELQVCAEANHGT